ncbi:hypothetical protein A6R68_12209, partial [Neotoma lepida]
CTEEDELSFKDGEKIHLVSEETGDTCWGNPNEEENSLLEQKLKQCSSSPIQRPTLPTKANNVLRSPGIVSTKNSHHTPIFKKKFLFHPCQPKLMEKFLPISSKIETEPVSEPKLDSE